MNTSYPSSWHMAQNEAIRAIRRSAPASSQRYVATAIATGTLQQPSNKIRYRSFQLGKRSFFSIYNVVRKHDAMEKLRLETQFHNELPELT